MSLAIKQTIQTGGWDEIKELFENEILNNSDTKNIKESLSPEHIKLEVMSRNKASKIVNRVLEKIQRIADADEIKQKITYR